MQTLDLTGMPVHFTLCQRENCERHDTCLHWLAYVQSPMRKFSFFYDPRWIDANGGTAQCSEFIDASPVTYAKGFEHLYEDMPKSKADLLRHKLLNHFGDYNYYRYRRGEFLMPPVVQQYIRDAAAELGITSTITFDHEQQLFCWKDAHVRSK